MKPPLRSDHIVCPECGARNNIGVRNCWLCLTPLNSEERVSPTETIVTAEPAPSRQHRFEDTFFWILTTVCLWLSVLVGIGLAGGMPGLLIPYCVFLAPALIATCVGAASKFSAGETPSGKEVFVRFITSTAITIAVICLTAVAAILALFAYCLFLISLSP
jgi:hypothetical protein